MHGCRILKWIESQLEVFFDTLEKADIYNDLYDDFRMPVQKPIVKEKKVYPNDTMPIVEVEKNIKKMLMEENSNGDFNMQRQYIFTKNGFYPENTGEEIEDEEVAELLMTM